MKTIDKAARAYSDLNIFAAVTAIMEGGFVYTPTGKRLAAKITKLCQAECQRQIRIYDRLTERMR